MGNIKLTLRTKPSVYFSHQLQKTIHIVKLNQGELQEEISKKLLENPFLEEKKPPHFEYTPYARNVYGSSPIIENFAAQKVSLLDYLESQIRLFLIPKDLLKLVEAIISSIDDRGFVTMSHQKIASEFGYSEKQLKEALKYIRQLEPTGVCAENEWQALEWQAEVLYPQDYLFQDFILILKQKVPELNELTYHKEKKLAELVNLPVEQVKRFLVKIKRLDPYPVRNFYEEQENMVYPDIIYLEKNGKIQIEVAHELLSEISLNEALIKEIPNTPDKKNWDYYYREAVQFLQAIEFRKKNLYDLAIKLLAHQKPFFTKGPNFLRPLTMRDLAKEMQLHVSTISRLVANKYCHCKWGIFPLRYFFVSKIKGTRGESYVPEDLRLAILRLIAEEDCENPYSDQELVEKLKDLGFLVKRRTVAKYRSLLHLKTAKERKFVRPYEEK